MVKQQALNSEGIYQKDKKGRKPIWRGVGQGLCSCTVLRVETVLQEVCISQVVTVNWQVLLTTGWVSVRSQHRCVGSGGKVRGEGYEEITEPEEGVRTSDRRRATIALLAFLLLKFA